MSETKTESDDADWQTVGYVAASDHRLGVIRALKTDSPSTPSKISDRSGLEPTHVSRVLTDLADHNLVELLNPEAHKGRLYTLTEDGQNIGDLAMEASS